MTLAEEINRMIETVVTSLKITSAGGDSPKINRIHDENIMKFSTPDLEQVIKDQGVADGGDIAGRSKGANIKADIALLKQGNVGQIQQLSSKQFGNIRSMAVNPAAFIMGAFLSKFARGAGYAALVLLAVEVAKFLALELFKPGRMFDVRFRQAIDKQILTFMERKEQQELKQGFKQVITTTIGGLRGNTLAGQIGGNFYYPDRIPNNFLDVRRSLSDNLLSQNAQRRSINPTRTGSRVPGGMM